MFFTLTTGRFSVSPFKATFGSGHCRHSLRRPESETILSSPAKPIRRTPTRRNTRTRLARQIGKTGQLLRATVRGNLSRIPRPASHTEITCLLNNKTPHENTHSKSIPLAGVVRQSHSNRSCDGCLYRHASRRQQYLQW